MTVYIDTARRRLGRMIMCHMFSDSEDLTELHTIARAIGMKPEWFQGDASFPHYDVSVMRKGAAVKLGAKLVTEYEGARIRLAYKRKHKRRVKYYVK